MRKDGAKELPSAFDAKTREKWKRSMAQDQRNWESATKDCGGGAEGDTAAIASLDIAFETMPIAAP